MAHWNRHELEAAPFIQALMEQVCTRPAVLLVNTHSRRGRELFETAKQDLSNLGIEVRKAVACDKASVMLREARAAVAGKVPLLVAGGGDGTFNMLAGILVDSETTLGVLPLGTGNAFARDLGISFDLHQACETISSGHCEAVDLGFANDRPFLNVATAGLTSKIVQSLEESMKRRFGRLVYIYAVAKALHTIKPFVARLKTDNGEIEFETLQVVIGNGRYHGGPFPLGPGASITSGKLVIYALEGRRKAAFIRLALSLFSGSQGTLSEVHYETAKHGTLTAKPAAKITLDGEVGPTTPLRFEVRHDVLKVVVPKKVPSE